MAIFGKLPFYRNYFTLSEMFQTDSYCGGYDADEEAFCFSYYDVNEEYWFQLTLIEIKNIHEGTIALIKAHLAK